MTDASGERGSVRCQTGEADLGQLLVKGGWARPAALQAGAFEIELAQAQSEKAGLWRSDWTIVNPTASPKPGP